MMRAWLKSLGVAVLLALAGSLAQAQTTTLKLGHAAPRTDVQQKMSLFFKKEVESRTKGSVKVTVFPHGQLGTDAAMIDGTRTGVVDISMAGLNNFTGLVPQADVIELPFIFPTRAAAYKALDGAVGQLIAVQFKSHGLRVLGFPENGYRNMSNNRRPIRKPEDLAGLQMRVNNSRALSDMFTLLGATPQQLPVAELYSALETGVVDAQDHPIPIFVSFKFNEVQKYLSITQHAYSALALVMNEAKLNRLKPQEQEVITAVAAEAVAMQRAQIQETEADMIKTLQRNGVQVNTDVDVASFQAKVKPTWDAFIAQNGDSLIKAVQGAD